jgi:hypothetical protein
MESRPLPAMRNISHDGWLCTFTGQQQQLAAEQLLPGQTVRSGKAGGTDRPSQ